MYVPHIDDPRLSQGDIVNNVVLNYVTNIADPAFYLNEELVEKNLAQPFDAAEELTVLTEALKSTVLVIEPSCNIDNKDFISVARVLGLLESDNDYRQMNSAERKAKHLRKNYQDVGVQPNIYYLQESAAHGFPKSFASFLEIHTIRKNQPNLDYLTDNRILRLTPEALGDLQYRIGFFFGRYAVTTENYMLTQAERDEL